MRVTGEVCPHHLLLTDKRLSSFDSNFKMNPPLRTAEDVASPDRRPQGRHPRRHCQRSFAAGPGEEEPGTGPGSLRRHRPGDAAADLHHGPDRAGPSDLAAVPGKADDQPGPHPRHRSRHACKPGKDADVTIIDPSALLDDRPGEISFEEPQHAVRRAGGQGSGMDDDR